MAGGLAGRPRLPRATSPTDMTVTPRCVHSLRRVRRAMGALFASSRAGGESGRREFRGGRGEKAGAPLSPRHARGVSQRTRGGPSIALGRPARGGRRGQIADPRTGVAPGVTRSRNVRSRGRCSMCPAIHITSRSWLRSSSTHEPSDPPPRVVSRIEFRLFSREGSRERDGLATAGVFSVTHERDKRKKKPEPNTTSRRANRRAPAPADDRTSGARCRGA